MAAPEPSQRRGRWRLERVPTRNVFRGFENGTFGPQITFSTGGEPYSVQAGDFNSDNRLDIVVANFLSDDVSVLLGYGNGSFTNETRYSTGAVAYPNSVAVDDLNKDNTLDIVVTNWGTNSLGVFLGLGNGTFSSIVPIQIAYGSHPFFVVIGDFNNDGKADFAVANNGTDSLNILLQTC